MPDPSPEFDALLAGVLAAPDDDVPRLVAADWLDEHGRHRRAAYVRASVELAALVRAGDYDEPYLAATAAVSSVPTAFVWEWLREDGLPLPAPGLLTRDLVGDRDGVRRVMYDLTVGVRRGFAESVRGPLALWAEHARGMVARAPLTRVELTDRKPHPHRRDEWVWRRKEGQPGDASNVLPDDLFELLPDARGYVAVYPRRRAAEDALSVACLALGRGAGQPG